MDVVRKTPTRAGRPKAADVAKRTDALLATTEELLVKLGYERTTLNVIAAEANVSKQTIYVKYGGKLGLLRAVLQRMSERSASARLADADDLPLYEGLYTRIHRLMSMLRSETAVAITTIAEREGREFPEFRVEMLASRERHLLEPLRNYIDDLKRRGLSKDVSSCQIASMLLWATSEEVIDAAATGQISNDEIAPKAACIARVFSDALRPGPH